MAASGAGAPAAAVSGAGGTLYVVATPIGNLGDVTLRALEVLRAVPLVAAEDTRLTRRLFARHGIATRMVSHHARNAAARVPELVGHLRGGADLAVVTDAGTPLVSDPGDALVAAWAAEGGRVVPIPGPSAVLAALVASGIAGPRWGFEGFLPRSGRERRARIARLAADDRTTVLFEAPGRLAATLADLAVICGPGRTAAVCRELTKLHEEIVRGTLGQLAEAAADGRIAARGEIAVVVGDRAAGDRHADGVGAVDAPDPLAAVPADLRKLAAAAGASTTPTSGAPDRLAAARAEVERLVAGGEARGAAARRVATASGIPRRRLYRADPAR